MSTFRVYYNDHDLAVCKWIKNLIVAGLLPDGEVDSRPIQEVQPSDVKDFNRAHFFCGIAGWELALQLARWESTAVTWTGSPPCQPFSVAGKGKAQADARHLWPAWFRLIRECRPEHVFGEQVTGAIGWGWLDGVSTDLEEEGYAVGSAVLGAHSVGAPHIRNRLFWVANAIGRGRGARRLPRGVEGVHGEAEDDAGTAAERGSHGGLGDAERYGRNGTAQPRSVPTEQGEGWHGKSQRPDGTPSPWSDSILIPCADGKARRISPEPSDGPLAYALPLSLGRLPLRLRQLAKVAGLDGVSLKRAKSYRVGGLRGYGNAVVAPIAAAFIAAYMDGQQEDQ